MEKPPRDIDSNPCDNDWNKMEVNETGDKRFCSSCSEFVHDLTKKDVFEFSQKDLKGKCISLHESQFQDLMFIYPLKRFAVAIFIVFGSSLFVIPESFAQEMSAIIKQEDFVNVNGRVVDKKGNGVEHVRAKIYYQDGEKVY